MEKSELQLHFDDLIELYGPEAIIEVIHGHVSPASGGTCKTTGCPPHYVCNTTTGDCVLDLGRPA